MEEADKQTGIPSRIRALKEKCQEGDIAKGVCPPLPEGRRESMGEGGCKKKNNLHQV